MTPTDENNSVKSSGNISLLLYEQTSDKDIVLRKFYHLSTDPQGWVLTEH